MSILTRLFVFIPASFQLVSELEKAVVILEVTLSYTSEISRELNEHLIKDLDQ
jgi:hypothetical protein